MAYAAVISLDYAMERHTGRSRAYWKRSSTQPRMKEFALMLDSLQRALLQLDEDDKRAVDRRFMNELDAEITEAAWKLEDVLQSYAFNQSVQIVVEEKMDLFMKRAKMLRDEYNRLLEKPWHVSDKDEYDDFGGESERERPRMIGLWDQFEEIRNELLDLEGGAKTVALVGMAGIGKTRLAREIFQHPTILEHFDELVWVRVGVKHRVENIFADILAELECKPRKLYRNTYRGMYMRVLASHLHKILCGRRCLMVLDDVWSKDVCGYLNDWLVAANGGGDGNRRRIIVTTRLEGVVKGCHSTRIHNIRFLNDEESWNLLWRNVFLGEECFPFELEKAGRKIAENCEGLPLLILTVAGILRGLDKTEEYWMKVANKKTTTFDDACEKIEKVLRVSYDYRNGWRGLSQRVLLSSARKRSPLSLESNLASSIARIGTCASKKLGRTSSSMC